MPLSTELFEPQAWTSAVLTVERTATVANVTKSLAHRPPRPRGGGHPCRLGAGRPPRRLRFPPRSLGGSWPTDQVCSTSIPQLRATRIQAPQRRAHHVRGCLDQRHCPGAPPRAREAQAHRPPPPRFAPQAAQCKPSPPSRARADGIIDACAHRRATRLTSIP